MTPPTVKSYVGGFSYLLGAGRIYSIFIDFTLEIWYNKYYEKNVFRRRKGAWTARSTRRIEN